MQLSDQVCALEYSKRLAELGVKQSSLFVWLQAQNTDIYKLYPSIPFFPDEGWRDGGWCPDVYGFSAFTVAELGEMLPKELIINGIHYYYTQIPCADLKKWSIFYRNDFSGMPDCDEYDENEANARAKMAIYLLENGLIENV